MAIERSKTARAGATGLALLAALGAGALFSRPADASDVKKTLTRVHDPVIVPGARLSALPIRDTAKLRLHRFEGGRAVAIPHQIDQRDESGDLVVDGPRDFAFDDNDELVFMAKDAGDRTIADPCPSDCTAALEIEIRDPAGGESAWVYLAAYPEPPPAPPFEPYVTFDVEKREARSANYRVQYAPARNYFTGLSVGEAAGGKNVNLLRQSRMHGEPTFSLFVTDFALDFTEQNSIVEIDGVRNGPVRAIRRARLSVDLGPMFPELPSGIAYTDHYLTSYTTPTRVSFPWIMLQTVRDFRFEAVLDFSPAAMPMRYFDAANPDGVSLGPGDEIRTSEDHDWWVHSGAAGTVLHAFVIPERWREWGVARGAVVRRTADDVQVVDSNPPVALAADPPKGIGGNAPRSAGYTLLHMTKLQEAGTYDLLMASVVLPTPFHAGDEAAPMAMLRAPLTTVVRRVR